jgi:hypothetical protein
LRASFHFPIWIFRPEKARPLDDLAELVATAFCAARFGPPELSEGQACVAPDTRVKLHRSAYTEDLTMTLRSSAAYLNPERPPNRRRGTRHSRRRMVAGQDIRATSKGVDSAGTPTTAEWTVNYDGKDRPQTGNPDADTLSLKRIDAFTTEWTQKRAGKVVITGTRTISRDGKVMTITSKGTNAKGQTMNNAEVFEKR